MFIKQTNSLSRNIVQEDLHDRFEALINQESSYKHSDYLNGIREGGCIDKKEAINRKSRFKMAIWCFMVAEFCDCDDEIVSITMSYVDKFLSSKQINVIMYDARWFHLLVMCSFHLAVKFNATNKTPNINMDFLVQISRRSFTKEEILLMKRDILRVLSWRLCPPTSYVFLDFIASMLPQTISKSNRESIRIKSRKQLKSAVLNYRFSVVDPSTVAFASIFNAMEEIDDLPKDIQQKFIYNISNLSGFKYTVQKDCTFSTVKILLCKLLNRKTDDAVQYKRKITHSDLKDEEQKNERDRSSRFDTISPHCRNALITSAA